MVDTPFMFAVSPMQSMSINGHSLFIKRDDLLHPAFSGNKARKFAYFVINDFPKIKRLIGYGSPQANSLYSMSALAQLRGWQLDFYVDHIAQQILDNPIGNYGAALANGANVIDLSKQPDRNERDTLTYIEQVVLANADDSVLFVPEGGRCHYAEVGLQQLASELKDWLAEQSFKQARVFLPSGTGTTALYLNKALMQMGIDIEVLTCSCVGGEDYLKTQFIELDPTMVYHPLIITSAKKHHFGKLYPECYQMWQQLRHTGIEFELLYDPVGFIVLQQFLQQADAKPTIYIHQGGLLGNQTMLPRYQRKYGGLDKV